MFAIFSPAAEKNQKILTLVGLKFGKKKTRCVAVFMISNFRLFAEVFCLGSSDTWGNITGITLILCCSFTCRIFCCFDMTKNIFFS